MRERSKAWSHILGQTRSVAPAPLTPGKNPQACKVKLGRVIRALGQEIWPDRCSASDQASPLGGKKPEGVG
jgi:hypothetical protein